MVAEVGRNCNESTDLKEKLRDANVERDGDGLRKAWSVVQELCNDIAMADVRGTVMSQEVQGLCAQIDRMSAERNHIVYEMDGLRGAVTDLQSDQFSKCDEMGQLIKIAEKEVAIARFEREKVVEVSDELKDGIRKRHEVEQERVVAMARRESRVKELKMQPQTGNRFRQEESMWIEEFTGIVEEKKD